MFNIGVCRPCPDITGTNPQRTTCICKDPKQIYDISKAVCVPLPAYCAINDDYTDCKCFPGYKKENGVCVNTCPTGATPDVTGQCICGGGFYLEGNVCKQPVQCPPRSTWNTVTLVCVCDTAGENLIDNTCQKCGENSFYSAATKQCLCSTGFFMIGAQCVLCDPRTKYNGTDCVCNLGYFGNRDLCTKCHDSCATCSGPEANQCQSCSDVSLILQNGYCSKNIPCDPGFFLGETSC
jgi:proprotein convertase subtilisin/kexin type 5